MPLGIIFNFISLVIFLRFNTYRTPTGLHLKWIAIADTIVIVGSLIFKIRESKKYIDVPEYMVTNGIFCKVNLFVLSMGISLSGMLLVSATIERFVSIAFPLKVKSWNLMGTTRILITVYLVTCLGCATGAALTSDLTCGLTKTPSKTAQLWNIISSSILFVGFTGLTFIFTSLIAIFLFINSRKRSYLSQSNNRQSNKEFQISLMLFAVAFLFTILRIPRLSMYQIRLYYSSKGLFNNTHFIDALKYWPIAKLLVVVNHSINFVIYMIFIQNFRQAFVKMFSRSDKNNQKSELFRVTTTIDNTQLNT